MCTSIIFCKYFLVVFEGCLEIVISGRTPHDSDAHDVMGVYNVTDKTCAGDDGSDVPTYRHVDGTYSLIYVQSYMIWRLVNSSREDSCDSHDHYYMYADITASHYDVPLHSSDWKYKGGTAIEADLTFAVTCIGKCLCCHANTDFSLKFQNPS